MGKPIPRNEIIKNLKVKIDKPVIGCGAGTAYPPNLKKPAVRI